MKKIILIGRSGCGKTSLTQAMLGLRLTYKKTQAVGYHNLIIDTPGEYAETKQLASALALYSYEAQVVGPLLSANEPYSLFSPNITSQANREVIGIITKIDCENADLSRAKRWLRLAGCKTIFPVSSFSGQGLPALLDYLKEPEDTF